MPLASAVVELAARLGLVAGNGLGAVIRERFRPAVVYPVLRVPYDRYAKFLRYPGLRMQGQLAKCSPEAEPRTVLLHRPNPRSMAVDAF